MKRIKTEGVKTKMFTYGDKIYIISNSGEPKTGVITGSWFMKDSIRYYPCSFGVFHTSLPESKINQLNLNVVNGEQVA